MQEQTFNPGKRLKRLHRKSGSGESPKLSLKEFAIELQTNGSATDKALVNGWLDNKAPEPGKKKEAPAAKLPIEPPKKPAGKKR